jgi:dolichyl-diphosphooligosaccharide---protein glycosyltransferase subunit DAD1/OST2
MVASLRSQVDKANRAEFPEVSPERLSEFVGATNCRAFADFVVSSIVLHFFVVTFIG